jgi:hypothetical protein
MVLIGNINVFHYVLHDWQVVLIGLKKLSRISNNFFFLLAPLKILVFVKYLKTYTLKTDGRSIDIFIFLKVCANGIMSDEQYF